MDQDKPKSETKDLSDLDEHALESKRNPGEYVGRMAWRTSPSSERYRNKYASIFDHSKLDLRHNAEQAVEMNFGQWVEMCRAGGPWDFACDPLMQEGVRQGLYTQELLVSFSRFHAGFTSAALGARTESADKWMKHLGFDRNDESFRKDYGLGWRSYWAGNFDKPRNDWAFQTRRRADWWLSMNPEMPEVAPPRGAEESKRNPGRYISYLGYIVDPTPTEAYRSKYASIFENIKLDLRHNAEEAYEMNFDQWVEMCRDGGPWDFESDPLMQKGIQQGLYPQRLLVGFRRFHLRFTSSALGLLL